MEKIAWMAVVTVFVWAGAGIGTAARAASPNPAEILGRTPEEIHQRFATIIEHNLASGDTEHLLNNLQERELADLAMTYNHETGGHVAPLLGTFARNLSANSLARIAPHFGYSNVAQAVERFASGSVRKEFAASVAARASVGTSTLALRGPVALGGPAPTIDMTIYEIYLEYRTAPIGSLSIPASIFQTGVFASKNLALAAGIGWEIGTQIHDLIQQYDPALDDIIGGTVDQALQNISDAVDSAMAGHYEQAADHLFGGPVESSGNDYGDYNTTWDMGELLAGGAGGACRDGACIPNSN